MKRTERFANVNEAIYGKEPKVSFFPVNRDGLEFQTAVSSAINWYKKNTDMVTRKGFYMSWLQDFSSEDVKKINSLNETKFGVVGPLARIWSNGIQDSSYINDKLMESLEKFQVEITENEDDIEDTSSKIKSLVRDAKTSSLIASLNCIIDDFIEDKFKNKKLFDMKTWLELNRPSPIQFAAVKETFRPMLEEVRQSFSDEYLNEAYSHMSKKERTLFCEFLQNIVGAKRTRKSKKERKQRAKKEKPVEVIVSKVKYCTSDPVLQIKSRKPEDVVSSKFVMTYNVKYRVVNYLTAEAGKTLEIKGTTIQNIDEKNSFAKRIRKPDEIIPVLQKANENSAKRTLGKLTTQDIPATGRLNEDVLILRCM